MSSLDLYNALQLADMKDDAKRSTEIMELTQRADSIRNNTGEKPASWYEYKIKNEEKLELHPVGKAIVGALIGAAVGALVMTAIFGTGGAFAGIAGTYMIMGTVGFGITGAIIGNNIEVNRENRANERLVKSYDNYLNNFEKSASLGVASEINYRDDHAARLKAQFSERTR